MAVTLESPEGKRIELDVELAMTEEQRALGLMGRTGLAEGSGMLFLFDQPQELAFWMKNTLIPLDIIFFDDQRNVVSASTMVPCEADPCAQYVSYGASSAFALEVPAGYVQRQGIAKGWHLSW